MNQNIKRKLTAAEKSFVEGLAEIVKYSQGRKAKGIHAKNLSRNASESNKGFSQASNTK